MREIRTSGSVGGRGGNPSVYPTLGSEGGGGQLHGGTNSPVGESSVGEVRRGLVLAVGDSMENSWAY
ncbi:MAG: hypothetical protein AMXMBFR33_17480 [Candidatus Xenobia bacterium]